MSLKINPILPKHQPFTPHKYQIMHKVADNTKQNNQAINRLAVRFGGEDETKPTKKTADDFFAEVKKEKRIDAKISRKPNVPLHLELPKSSKNMSLEDYTETFDKALFKKAGYEGKLTKDDLKLAGEIMRKDGWNWEKWNVESLRKTQDKPGAMFSYTSESAVEKAKIAGQAVLRFREYEAKLKDSNNAAGENETNQMLIDHGKVIYNSIVNNVEGTINTGIDLIRFNNGQNPLALVDPNRPQVSLSAIKTDYRSEMMRRDINGKLDGNGLKRGDFTEGAVTILAPLVVGKVSSPTKLNTLESLGALPEVTVVPKTFPKIGKLEFEPNAKASTAELKTANKLVNEGKSVKVLKEIENQKGVRTPDFEVDGVKTELKTVENIRKVDADNLSKSISRRILEAGGQAKNIILDVSNQNGMTKEIAERAIKRSFGRLRELGSNQIKEVRVIGKEFDIVVEYKPPTK
jgi:Contact-dependent growth inhibition CdiA C-terminal domain